MLCSFDPRIKRKRKGWYSRGGKWRSMVSIGSAFGGLLIKLSISSRRGLVTLLYQLLQVNCDAFYTDTCQAC